MLHVDVFLWTSTQGFILLGLVKYLGELLLRLLILHVISNDIQLAAGALQTCADQDAGSEAAIHAMRTIF